MDSVCYKPNLDKQVDLCLLLKVQANLPKNQQSIITNKARFSAILILKNLFTAHLIPAQSLLPRILALLTVNFR